MVSPDMIMELMAKIGRVEIIVGGFSMFPLILPNSTVVVRPVCPSWIGIGDIIVIERNGRILCHKVKCVRKDDLGLLFLTKGTLCSRPDPPSREKDIIGRVESISFGKVCAKVDSSFYKILSCLIDFFSPLLRILSIFLSHWRWTCTIR